MSTELNAQSEETQDPVNTPGENGEAATNTEKSSAGKEFLSFFKPTNGYYITPILLLLNILIFVVMAISGVSIFEPDNESLLRWGANFRPVTLDGEWWRLISNCFLHIGIIHLLMNMYALLYIGSLLEPVVGAVRFIAAYLLAGFGASVTSLWWHDFTISAGASGAIFGMYGLFIALLTTSLIEKTTRQALLSSIGIFVAYNLVNGLKGGIDNAAHIGGLISGLLIGYALLPGLKNPQNRQLTTGTIALLAVLFIGGGFYVSRKIPNDIALYDEKMKTFTALETKALEVYNLTEGTNNDTILNTIKRGSGYWEENKQVLNSVSSMKLPEALVRQNELLREYCDLRIRSYQFLYKTIAENTEQYRDSLEKLNLDIEKKINEIGGIREGKK